MTNSEKLQVFKRLYVTAQKLVANLKTGVSERNLQEADINKTITSVEEMIALLPLTFHGQVNAISEPVLLINPQDPEDEPKETKKRVKGNTTYILPENTIALRESTVLFVLEDWKFLIINYVAEQAPEENTRQKYMPLMLAQAQKCLAFFPDTSRLYPWQNVKVVLYANQIGWHAVQEEQDPAKMEEALAVVEQGVKISNWYDLKYIVNTYVRLLLKLGRSDDAYTLVGEAFRIEPNYADFQDLKKDAQYISWKEAEAVRKAAGEEHKKKEREAFLITITEEQAKIKDQFINPDHVLVRQHATILNVIKQRMLANQMTVLNEAEPDSVDDLKSDFRLYPWSVEKLEAFETKHGLKLPDEFKVYLMEVGSGGDYHFYMGGIVQIDEIVDEFIAQMKKTFPITVDKIHEVDNFYGVKAWVYSDDEDWIAEGVFPKGTDMKALFGLPAKAKITDGCMFLGNSVGQNELFMIMNGEFEGEVWSDRLQYGAEVRGCFGPATTKRLKFLEYIADSLGRDRRVGGEDEGDWM
jgi:tetratricopeptide (TPR) repeat protein